MADFHDSSQGLIDQDFPFRTQELAMRMYVDIEALNLRSAPTVASGNRLGVLHLGQAVEVGESDDVEWHKAEATLDGKVVNGFIVKTVPAQPVTGFIALPSVRMPVSDAREALVAAAVRQWLRFDRGLGKETVDPYVKFVGEMWKAIGIKLTGKDTDQPWSAAAISFMVRDAAQTIPAYASFKFAAAHSKYIHDAIAKRKAGAAAPFWGFRLQEATPQIGDIVGRWRVNPRSYDDAAVSDAFKSHTDIVVSVTPDHVLAIGGNVGDSVGITRYEKLPSGHLSDKGSVIVLMVNQT